MREPRKKNKKTNTVPSLSSVEMQLVTDEQQALDKIKKSVYATLNNNELEKALDGWLKNHGTEHKIAMRDLSVLKTTIMEFLDVFLLFGYDMKGNRIIIQNFNNARDRDAVMEFLKTIFIKQQQDSFLDGDE
jgi:hypothetical protein